MRATVIMLGGDFNCSCQCRQKSSSDINGTTTVGLEWIGSDGCLVVEAVASAPSFRGSTRIVAPMSVVVSILVVVVVVVEVDGGGRRLLENRLSFTPLLG